jgi:hypothetical protein
MVTLELLDIVLAIYDSFPLIIGSLLAGSFDARSRDLFDSRPGIG